MKCKDTKIEIHLFILLIYWISIIINMLIFIIFPIIHQQIDL